MRFFFHFSSNDSVYEDATGEHFSSLEDAINQAHIIAAQLNLDGPNDCFQAILVTDQKGTELARVTIQRQQGSTQPH